MTDNSRERSVSSQAISDAIRAERARAGRTQVELARAAGIPRPTYIRIEKGTRVPDVTQVWRICDALGLTLVEFYRRVEEVGDFEALRDFGSTKG